MILSIAWKNIWRNKTRSMVVITATMLGLIAGSFTVAFLKGMVSERLTAAINKEVSHIQIHMPSYLGNHEIMDTLPNALSLCREIQKNKHVRNVTARSGITGMVMSANASQGILILGINPVEEKKITIIYRTIVDSGGSYFGEDRKNQILVGAKLAEKLKVHHHSKIVLRFIDINGNVIESAFRITGIFNTHNDRLDDRVVYIKNQDLAGLLGRPVPYHEIAIILNDIRDAATIAAELQNVHPELKVQVWTELQPEFAIWIGMTDKIAFIFLGIILLALAFGIINTMLMSVLERTKELGMLMSIGMNTRKVFRMIMLETILLTFTGGIIGMGLAFLLIRLTHHSGINLASVSRGMEAMGIEATVYPDISGSYFILLSFMILVTAILSAIYPARKALQVQPAEALKME